MKKTSAPDSSRNTLISKLKNLRIEELGLLESMKKNQLKADMVAYNIGMLIDQEVEKQKANKKENVVKSIAQALTVTPQTIYNYMYLYRGTLYPHVIEDFQLPRKYYQAVGSAIDPRDGFISTLVWRAIIKKPILDEDKEPDAKKIKEVGRLFRDTRQYVQREYKYDIRKIEWESAKMDKNGEPDYVDCVMGDISDECAGKVHVEINKLFQNIDALTGMPNLIALELDKGILKDAGTTKTEIDNSFPASDSVQGIRYTRDRQRRTDEAMSFVKPQTNKTLSEKFFKGDSCKILKDPSKFPERSIDVVITDPPYSLEYYDHAYRSYSMIEHHAEKTIDEQVKVVADIAQTIVQRKICKEKFMWFSFFPLKAIHKLVSPILKAFEGTPYAHQILIWDKKIGPKTGTTNLFQPQLEAILFITINRPLAKVNKMNQKMGYHTPLLSYMIQRKGALTWKPIPLLKHLIHLSTYGDDHSEKAKKQVILDPFGGRGSTGIAAIECDRDFRLIELHDKQYKIAYAQLSKALAIQKK